MKKNKILLISGGTFGHLFPSMYLSKVITKHFDFFYITDNKLNNCKFLFNNYFFFINTYLFKNKNFFFIFNIFISFLNIFFTLILFKPKIILCFGNYLTVPLFFLSFFFNFSFFIFEQNLIIGRSNLILFFFSKKFFVHYQRYHFFHKISKICYFKYFVNKNVFLFKKTISLKKKNLKILFIGGSGGSYYINKIVFDFYNFLNKNFFFFFFLSQTGDHKYDYLNYSISFFKKSLLVNSHNYLNNFDFLISRSGAGILNELYLKSIYFIILPIKYSVLNHQYFNCLYFFRKKHFLYLEENEYDFAFFYKFLTNNFIILNNLKIINIYVL